MTEQDARRPLDPVIAGFADGVNAGCHAVEFVVAGLHEGLRRQSAGTSPPLQTGADRVRRAAGPPPSAFAPRAGRAAAGQPVSSQAATPQGATTQAAIGSGGAIVDHLLGALDELLGVASNATRNLADLRRAQAERTTAAESEPETGAPFQVHMEACPGREATGAFTIWNTGASMVSDVRFGATDLIGAAACIGSANVSFLPNEVPRLAPGASSTVKVVVHVAPEAAPGCYRGVIQTTIGGTWAVVDLEVLAAAAA